MVKPCQVMFWRPAGSLNENAIMTPMGANRKSSRSPVKTGSSRLPSR